MSGGELNPRRAGELLRALPEQALSLSSLEGKKQFLAAWSADKTLIPGVIRSTGVDQRQFDHARVELAERRNTVLSLELVKNLRELLEADDFLGAVHGAFRLLAERPMATAQGLDLVGSLEENLDWISELFKKIDASANSSAPIRWINTVKRPAASDRADFVRWWNQCLAIKTLATITAGIDSWSKFEEYLLDGDYGPLGSRCSWTKSTPLLPTGQTSKVRNVHVLMHAHPDLCQLLALDRKMDKRGSATWTVKFSLRNLAGDSQAQYRTATGLSVKHIYLATLVELLSADRSTIALRRAG